MGRIRKYKPLLLLFILFIFQRTYAQTWMNLRYSHIFEGNNYAENIPMGSLAGTAIWWNTSTPIQLRVQNSAFINTVNSTFQFRANNVSVQINDIGGHLPGTSEFEGTLQPMQYLSTSPISLFFPKEGLLKKRPRGIATMRFRIPSSTITNTTWRQGEYINVREYTTYNSGTLIIFRPAVENLYVEVDAILNWINPPTYSSNNLPSSIFNLYRNSEGLQLTIEGTLGTTLPFRSFLQSTANSISKDGAPANPSIPLNSVVVSGMDIKSGQSFPQGALSSTERELSPPSLFAIGTNNLNPLRYILRIPQDQLKLHFFRPGTYTIPALRLRKSATAVTTTFNEAGGQKSVEYQVPAYSFTIPEQQEIGISGSPEVFFNFNSVQSYQSNASHEALKEINISSNINYNIYVKAENSAFQSSGAATIPLDVLEIGPTNAQSGVNKITLSHAPQILIQSSPPSLDRKVNIKYSISPIKAQSHILGKPSGNYKTDVIFSFIAN